jgi:hypothetical protein
MPAETEPDKDWAINWLTAIAPPHVGISCLMGVEHHVCVDGTYSPIRDWTRPIVFFDHWGSTAMTAGPSSLSPEGNETPTQVSLFWHLPVGVIPVCVWSRLLLKRPLLHPLPPLNSRGAFCMAGVVPQQL